jgi:RecA/RadA recombinase
MSNIFNTLIKEIDNDYAAIADDGIAAGDVSGFVDTGSYAMNALLSGSIYGGMPQNKVSALAGEPSVGKTYYTLNICFQFLKDNPNGFIFYFESESAISRQMLVDRGIDVKRLAIIPVSTVQEFRTQAVKILDRYVEQKSADRPPMLFVLDSLGNLSTEKEMEDIAKGEDKRDMTRAQLVRGAFRVLTLKLGKANVPLIVTNHVYDVVGSYVPTKKMGGGSGLEYAASSIIFLSKKKDKKLDDSVGVRTGTVITAHLKKSRLTIEDKKVETWLNYHKGLDRYYGLLDIGERAGIIKKVSTKYEFPDGTKGFESDVKKNPELYFTKDVLDRIDAFCKTEFCYGQPDGVDEDIEEETVE